MRRFVVLFALIGAAVGLGACGGGSSTAASGTQATTGSTVARQAQTQPASGGNKKAHRGGSRSGAKSSGAGSDSASGGNGSGSGSSGSAEAGGSTKQAQTQTRQTSTQHGDRSIQTFGSRATGSDADAITTTLKRYYAAIKANDGSTGCALFTSTMREQITKLAAGAAKSGAGKPGCAKIVSSLYRNYPANVRKTLTDIHMRTVRVKGDQAFALFSLPGQPHMVMAMAREDGSWKVGALAGSELP